MAELSRQVNYLVTQRRQLWLAVNHVQDQLEDQQRQARSERRSHTSRLRFSQRQSENSQRSPENSSSRQPSHRQYSMSQRPLVQHKWRKTLPTTTSPLPSGHRETGYNRMGELGTTLDTHIEISLPTNEVIHKGLRTEVGVPCFASRSSMMS